METTKFTNPDPYTSFFKKWSIFTIVCESDFSKIHTCFPTISYIQILEFVTECLKTDIREVSDERAIERAITAIQQLGAEHVSFTVHNIQFHLYYTGILEPVYV